MKGTNPHPDKIHISPSTYDLIKDFTAFEWDPRQTKVKGKGEMTTSRGAFLWRALLLERTLFRDVT